MTFSPFTSTLQLTTLFLVSSNNYSNGTISNIVYVCPPANTTPSLLKLIIWGTSTIVLGLGLKDSGDFYLCCELTLDLDLFLSVRGLENIISLKVNINNYLSLN